MKKTKSVKPVKEKRMIQAETFVRQQLGRRGMQKVPKYIKITRERAEWLKQSAESTGRSEVEVIEQCIDTQRRIEQEAIQSA